MTRQEQKAVAEAILLAISSGVHEREIYMCNAIASLHRADLIPHSTVMLHKALWDGIRASCRFNTLQTLLSLDDNLGPVLRYDTNYHLMEPACKCFWETVAYWLLNKPDVTDAYLRKKGIESATKYVEANL